MFSLNLQLTYFLRPDISVEKLNVVNDLFLYCFTRVPHSVYRSGGVSQHASQVS